MLIALFSFFMMMAFLDRAIRRGRTLLLVTETRHKLFKLRDFLRQSALAGDVDSNSWLFDFLDTSLTRAATSVRTFTVYELAATSGTFDHTELERRYAELQCELKKVENHRFAAVFEGYEKALSGFLKCRHRMLSLVTRTVLRLLHRQDLKGRGERVISFDPDVSTLQEYCKI